MAYLKELAVAQTRQMLNAELQRKVSPAVAPVISAAYDFFAATPEGRGRVSNALSAAARLAGRLVSRPQKRPFPEVQRVEEPPPTKMKKVEDEFKKFKYSCMFTFSKRSDVKANRGDNDSGVDLTKVGNGAWAFDALRSFWTHEAASTMSWSVTAARRSRMRTCMSRLTA